MGRRFVNGSCKADDQACIHRQHWWWATEPCQRLTPPMVEDPHAETLNQTLFCETTNHSDSVPLSFFQPCRLCVKMLMRQLVRPQLDSPHPGLRRPYPVQLLITGPTSDGFWVRVWLAMKQASWARSVGLPFIIRYSSPIDKYSSAGQDGWHAFFSGGGSSAGGGSRLLQLDCRAKARLYEAGAAQIYPQDYRTALAVRALAARTLRDFDFKPRRRFEAAADAFWGARVPSGAAVLGVHLRGSDKLRGQRHAGAGAETLLNSSYWPLIRAFCCHHSGREHAVFVASEDARLVAWLRARMEQELPRTLLVEQSGVVRTTSRFAPGVALNGTSQVLGSLGGEVLMDTLLLSRCDYLLKPQSAVSEFATYLNPLLAVNSYQTFNMAGQPRPSWANASCHAPPKI